MARARSRYWQLWRCSAWTYFTSYYYATGEMMSALHPYNLQQYGIPGGCRHCVCEHRLWWACTCFRWALQRGRWLLYSLDALPSPTLSLIVAVTLIEDYVLTIVVSALSAETNCSRPECLHAAPWIWHFAIGAALAAITWYLTIRGRGESARHVFALLTIFVLMTVILAVGLIMAYHRGVPAVPADSSAQGRQPCPGHPPHANGLHERHGRTHWLGSRVKRQCNS